MSINLANGTPGRVDGAAVPAGYIGQIFSNVSSTIQATVQDAWHIFTPTANFVTLTPGAWELTGAIAFDNNGSTPNYYKYWGAWSTTAGNNTPTLPTFLIPTAGLNNIQIFMDAQLYEKHFLVMSPVILRTNVGSTTIYLNANSNQGNGANTNITSYIVAKRIG